MKYPKLNNAKSSRRRFVSGDIERIFGMKKPIVRYDVKQGIIIPDVISDNSGIPHIWSTENVIQVGFQDALSKLGISKRLTSDFIYGNGIQWIGLIDGEWRYLAVYADSAGRFKKPFVIGSLEFDLEFKEFSKEQGSMLIIDGRKILEQIESNLP